MTTSVVVFWVPNLLSVATIIVLSFTWWAVRKQARAADQLTEATKKQIQANEASAQAAREQVEVARRQIAESLRPILTFSTGLLAGEGKFKNEGGPMDDGAKGFQRGLNLVKGLRRPAVN